MDEIYFGVKGGNKDDHFNIRITRLEYNHVVTLKKNVNFTSYSKIGVLTNANFVDLLLGCNIYFTLLLIYVYVEILESHVKT